ncbi:MAG: ribulose-phosphate 3-epimerase [Bacteroidetes bacterium]|nr:ribulose-phosphate 3-epimerase [Bacteroidota bacterium]
MLLAPSILSANFAQLGNDIELLNKSNADWIHVDVMDGVFVPNISFGFPVLKSIKPIAKKPLDVHLMIANCDAYLTQFAEVGAAQITVHYEACTHLHRTISEIKKIGVKAGVAINPHTSVQLLADIVTEVDLVLVMSVNPGFGGQKFIDNTYSKISELKELLTRKNSKALIEVDGGVDLSNAQNLISAGADVLVAGNAVFGADDVLATINKFKAIK